MPLATATSPQKEATSSSRGRLGKERSVSLRKRSTGHLDGGVKMGLQESVSPGVDSWDPRSTQGRGECTGRAHEMSDGENVSTPESKPLESGHVPVNGINMYYEVHGRPDGVPLVLLHGGGSTIEVTFGNVLPVLAGSRRVIALEEQGHGRTTDRDAPVAFESSADDVAALLRHLKVDQADIFGFSNGASVALQVAIRHPRARAKAGLRLIDDQESRRSPAALGVHEAGGLLEHAAAAQGRLPEGEPGRAAAQDHARQGRRTNAGASRTSRTTRYGPSARRR